MRPRRRLEHRAAHNLLERGNAAAKCFLRYFKAHETPVHAERNRRGRSPAHEKIANDIAFVAAVGDDFFQQCFRQFIFVFCTPRFVLAVDDPYVLAIAIIQGTSTGAALIECET